MRLQIFYHGINPSAQFRIHGMLDKLSTHDFMYTVHSGARCSCMASSYGTKNSTEGGVELIYCRDMVARCFTSQICWNVYHYTQSLFEESSFLRWDAVLLSVLFLMI